MVRKGVSMPNARILVMGIAFKENCPDVRNTRVVDVIAELAGYGAKVDVYDPWVDAEEVRQEYGIEVSKSVPQPGGYDGIVVAVAHREFCAMAPAEFRALGKKVNILYDIKDVLPADAVDGRL
jgi:UDP-N-acetyl-D-galactosamine dehydrogenase